MRWGVLLVAAVLNVNALAQNSGQTQLPPPDPRIKQEFTLLRADSVQSLFGDDIIVEGNVHAQYRGYDLFADKLIGDRRTQIFLLLGKCRIFGNDSDVFGEQITIDFKSDTLSFEDGEAKLSPGTLQGYAQRDLFIKAGSGQGTTGTFFVNEGLVTTCDLDVPHSLFEARSTKVRPGKYAALRDARVEVLGHTLLRIPYLVLPLIENGTKYVPEVGQSPTEGYYVKTRINTPLRGDDYWDTRLEYMSELGTGIGGDLNYDKGTTKGIVSAYALLGDQRSATLSTAHKQELGAGTIQLDTNYQRQNYLTAPESTLFNARAQYVLPWAQGNTRLSWYRMSSDRSTFSSVNQSVSMGDTHQWAPYLSTSLDLSLNRSETRSTSFDSQAQRLDVRFNGKSEMRSFSADLLYQRSVPVGDTQNFFSSTDRTPMLTLRTDTTRLFGRELGRALPINSELSVGELADPASGGTISRTDFILNARRTENVGRTSLSLSGGFKQGFYSDDTAQYVLDYGVGATYGFGPKSRLDINYRYHRAFGYTPLSIDRTGRNDAVSIDLSTQVSPKFELSARTGYDVLQSDRGNVPWQQFWLRTTWKPSDSFQVRTSATYDTFNQVWGNNRIDFGFQEGGLRASLGSRYDGRRSVWAGTSLVVEGFKTGKTTLATVLDWNGYTKRFEAQHYSLVYSLHEAELVLDVIDNRVGFRSGRQIALFVRLKAFPISTPFGAGTRGQAVGSQPGFGF